MEIVKEGCANGFETKGYAMIGKRALGGSDHCLVLNWGENGNLIVTGEDFHEGYDRIANTFIDDLINEGHGKNFLRTS